LSRLASAAGGSL